MAEMTALNNNKQGKKEDKPATAREIAEAAERRLNKVLISKEAMKANIGHTASMGLQGGTTIGSAGVSSLVVGMTPQQHRNKVRVVRGLTALGLAVKGLHKGLKYGEGEFYMAAANGLAAAEASEMGNALGRELGARWGWNTGGSAPAEPAAAPAAPPPAVVPQEQRYERPPAIAMTPPVQGVVGEVREINPTDPVLAAFRANGRAAAHRRS